MIWTDWIVLDQPQQALKEMTSTTSAFLFLKMLLYMDDSNLATLAAKYLLLPTCTPVHTVYSIIVHADIVFGVMPGTD